MFAQNTVAVFATLFIVCGGSAIAADRGIIIAGQSNCAGKEPVQDMPSKLHDVPSNVSYHFYYEKDGQTYSQWDNQPTTGPEAPMMHRLADEHPNDNWYVVKYCKGGSPMSDWLPSASFRYDKLMQEINAAPFPSDLEYEAFVWVHGEKDSKTKSDAKDYNTGMESIIDQLRVDVSSPDMLFLHWLTSPESNDHPYVYYLQASMLEYEDERDQARPVSTWGAHYRGDGVHYDSHGQKQMGRRTARAFGDLQ